jgi:hypothetical protein
MIPVFDHCRGFRSGGGFCTILGLDWTGLDPRNFILVWTGEVWGLCHDII